MQHHITEELSQYGYQSIQMLGKGKFGEIYLVQAPDGTKYACKIAEGEREREILRREGKLQETLRHPLFAAYHDMFQTEKRSYLIMEYVEGESLHTLFRNGSLPYAMDKINSIQFIQHLAISLAEGVAYLHDRPDPILYRDLKPEHVIISKNGIKLLDLGCAAPLSVANQTKAGTKGFAAPEQLGEPEEKQGTYSDIYGLGKVLEWILRDMDRKGQNARDVQFRRIVQITQECTRIHPMERISSMRILICEIREKPCKYGIFWKNEFQYIKNICYEKNFDNWQNKQKN